MEQPFLPSGARLLYNNPMTLRVRWLAVLLVACLSAGCGRRAAPGPTEIVYWTGWSGHELDVQQQLVAEFNRSHPDIRVRMLSVFGSYQKVRIAFAGGDVPDVCSAVWSDELAGYAMRGALTPLDAYLEGSGRSASEFAPGAWDMLRYHDRTWGLVATLNADFIAYNKNAFAAKGLRPPANLAEFEAVNRALTTRAPDGAYKSYGMRPSGLLSWAYVFGGHWYEPETGRVTADHPRNVAALRWLRSFAREHDIRRMEAFESAFGSSETPSGPFFTGKQAMWPTGPWAAEFIRRYAPEDFRYGAFPYPYPPGGRPDCTQLASSIFVIPAAARHKDAAWTFLNWFLSPDVNRRFCESIGNGSALRAVAASPGLQSRPLLKLSARLAGGPNAFGPPAMPIWPTYRAEIARAEDEAVHGDADPGALLNAVQARITRDLARAQREAVY